MTSPSANRGPYIASEKDIPPVGIQEEIDSTPYASDHGERFDPRNDNSTVTGVFGDRVAPPHVAESFGCPSPPTLDPGEDDTEMLTSELDPDTPILPPATTNLDIFPDGVPDPPQDDAPQECIPPVASPTSVDRSDIAFDGTDHTEDQDADLEDLTNEEMDELRHNRNHRRFFSTAAEEHSGNDDTGLEELTDHERRQVVDKNA